ncbi:MAG TPA: type II and III secretion system protein family protein [Polyangia bacterium]|nr:type II and III secretion system protein family protein [Polyangia bacterium]
MRVAQAAPPQVARPPLEGLRDRLHFIFPGQKVEVQQLGLSLILSGQVKDAATAQEIEHVVTSYVAGFTPPGGGSLQIVNLLQVIGVQQVQLEVRFAEVSRTALRQIGVNLWTRTGGGRGDVAGGLLGPSTGLNNALAPDLGSPLANGQLQLPNGLPVITSPISGAFSLIFASAANSDVPLSGAVSLLASRGFAKTLAEPTLVALSGQEATFLAGGEFPIPIPQALGVISVEFKKFGVQLRFTPFVLADETIQLKLQTAVSDIDFSIGLRLANATVPGLVQRESGTTVRLRDGQSFAIAGLLSDKMRSTIDKVPLLGDLPILGALFRSSSFQREESELLVVVTPHLVAPVAKGERIVLPGEDEISEPGDLELFLFGLGESHAPAPTGRVGFIR